VIATHGSVVLGKWLPTRFELPKERLGRRINLVLHD